MARYDFRTQRLYVTHGLIASVTIEAERAQAHYLLNVLRLGDGARVLLFNGRDGEWFAEIEAIGRKACLLHVVERIRIQPPHPTLHYLFAPLKQARLDYMVQKAVEMGAGVLQPVLTQHTQVPKLKTERILSNIREAAEQCGILSLPELRPTVRLADLVADWPAHEPRRRLIFCDEDEEPKTPGEVLAPFAGSRLAILIGPEGGFSEEERAMLRERDFVTPISLGPNILRADTAAVAALALVQATAGDWRR